MKGKCSRRADNTKLMTCALKCVLTSLFLLGTILGLCCCLDIAQVSSLISVKSLKIIYSVFFSFNFSH